MSLSAKLTNWVYRVPAAVRRFQARHPGEEVLAAAATKALMSPKRERAERGAQWVGARRAVLIASEQRLVCGDWEIAVDQVTQASVLSFRGVLSAGLLLKIETETGRHYQFGLQHDEAWLKRLPFELKREDGKLGYSKLSIALRVGLLVYLVYLGYRWLSQLWLNEM